MTQEGGAAGLSKPISPVRLWSEGPEFIGYWGAPPLASCFLYPTPNAGMSKASQAFWEVDDIEREVAELKGRGVKFEEYEGTKDGIATGGGAKAVWFKDPDGNIMAVVQSD